MSITVITDSTSYLSKDWLSKNNVKSLSLSVGFGDKIYKEDNLSNKEFFTMLDQEGVLPKTSQPSIAEMEECFEEELSKGRDIIGVFLSSKMSGTYNTASILKKKFDEKYPKRRISIIDSKSNSMQLGVSVMAAINALNNSGEYDEVISAIEHTVDSSRFLFIPKTFKYLKMGGRIGSAKALLSSVLNIKPILTVENGETAVYQKVRSRDRGINKMIRQLYSDNQEYKVDRVVVHHINCIEEAKELALKIEKKLEVKVIIRPIGPVIGTHVGPGAIGIVYSTKELMH